MLGVRVPTTYVFILHNNARRGDSNEYPQHILSQRYNATVFYFDNISFLAHVLNQLFLPNESSISRASYRTMVLTIRFQLLKKQTILWR